MVGSSHCTIHNHMRSGEPKLSSLLAQLVPLCGQIPSRHARANRFTIFSPCSYFVWRCKRVCIQDATVMRGNCGEGLWLKLTCEYVCGSDLRCMYCTGRCWCLGSNLRSGRTRARVCNRFIDGEAVCRWTGVYSGNAHCFRTAGKRKLWDRPESFRAMCISCTCIYEP